MEALDVGSIYAQIGGINILNKTIYDKPKSEWPDILRKQAVKHAWVMGYLVDEILPSYEDRYIGITAVATAMMGLIEPMAQILARQLEIGADGMIRSWKEVDAGAADQARDVLKTSWQGLEKLSPHYGVIAHSMLRVIDEKGHSLWDKLASTNAASSRGLGRRGMVIPVVNCDDWVLNPNKPEKGKNIAAVPDGFLGVPIKDPVWQARVQDLRLRSRALHPKVKVYPGGVELYRWLGGFGFQNLSATSGQDMAGTGFVADNLLKTLPVVREVDIKAGGDGNVAEIIKVMYGGHEGIHRLFPEVPALYLERAVDIVLWRVLTTSASYGGGVWAGVNLEATIRAMLGENIAQGLEKAVGGDTNASYPKSGRWAVNAMMRSGLVRPATNGVIVNTRRVGNWIDEIDEARRQMRRRKVNRWRSLGQMSRVTDDFCEVVAACGMEQELVGLV